MRSVEAARMTERKLSQVSRRAAEDVGRLLDKPGLRRLANLVRAQPEPESEDAGDAVDPAPRGSL